MSKLRRNNICSSPRNRNRVSNDGFSEISTNGSLKLNRGKLMSHSEFFNRIKKSLYYGGNKVKMSIPLSDYIADTFSNTHNGYSLNRLNYSTVGDLRSTPCSLILAMIYLERLRDVDPAYTKHVTPTELFLVSMMIATKFYSGHDDEAPYVNWSVIGRTSPDNLLQMELAFLNSIDWKVYVSNEEFFEKVKTLEITLAQQQGMKRGFYTYSELNTLMPSAQVAKQFIQSMLVLSLSYAVLVATMMASVFLVSKIPGTYLNASLRIGENQTTGNSSSHQKIPEEFPTMFSMTTFESTNSDLDELMNFALHRLNDTSEFVKPTNYNSTWYSTLFLNENLNWNNFFNFSANCNPLHNADRGFSGIKMKWA